MTMMKTRSRRCTPLLLLLLLVVLLLAAATAAAAASRPAPSSDLAKKKHDDDDDDKPPAPAPGPDDDDPIAQMKACHAERGKGRDACLAVPGGHCEYCKPGSALPLPNVCVHTLEAKLMPKILWECDAGDDPSPPADSTNGDACEGLHEAACVASKGVCVWCVAAAVPSSCFTVEQATKLPPGVFECGVAPSSSATAVF
jgi:hypothetical protein